MKKRDIIREKKGYPKDDVKCQGCGVNIEAFNRHLAHDYCLDCVCDNCHMPLEKNSKGTLCYNCMNLTESIVKFQEENA